MKIGIIGLGSRCLGLLKTLLSIEKDIVIAAVADPAPDSVTEKLSELSLSYSPKLYTEADEMLDYETLDGVFVATRCNLHAQLAIKVLKRKIPLFLEKPIATNLEDLRQLNAFVEECNDNVVVSFPLRLTSIVQKAKEIVLSGDLGDIENVNAFNDVPYGGVYYHNWYRDENTTQGLFLQKATHDFDVLNSILTPLPVEICAMTSKRIFTGDMPAGLKCDDCDRQLFCWDSKYYNETFRNDSSNGDYCAFAVDTGNEDSGSALIRYNTGMHTSYSQNFFSRKKAARRGARLYGYRGTLEFDFYAGEKVRVYDHFSGNVTDYDAPNSLGGHGGGDSALMRNFADIMRGEDISRSTLADGIKSALMCLRARESAQNSRFCKIEL
ncbi:MAG: Gfo/Idh/MocA family oxidoreductase [Ruminococcaceae bacterium]|nr:Gfo/Idh/MocA family oxidoreductase [Oscillospiraceae bacterium]